MHEVIALSMRRSLAVMSLLCSILAVVAEPSWSAPAFYKGLEGPRYSVVRNGTGWELRTYEPAAWISTKLDAPELDLATGGVVDDGFTTLFDYISGGNEAGAKINMTVPVLTKMEAGPGNASCFSTFTISFYIPDKYQGSEPAPQPSDNSTFINKMPTMDVYVLSFEGVANSTDYEQHLLDLIDKLETANESFTATYWFTAGYDSPDTLTNRHNEVWLPAVPANTTAAPAKAKAAPAKASAAMVKKPVTAAKPRAAPATPAAVPKVTAEASAKKSAAAPAKPTAAPTKPPAASGRKLYQL